VVDKVADALNAHAKSVRGSSILVLGVAYKKDIDDMRESPAVDVMHELVGKGALVTYHDPFVPAIAARDWPAKLDLASVALDATTLAAADCVVILTDHSSFDKDFISAHARLIVDSRNAIKKAAPHVFKLGAPHGKA
jgi:UDP-N-acetyl-D-glucosamine dehydrogenase